MPCYRLQLLCDFWRTHWSQPSKQELFYVRHESSSACFISTDRRLVCRMSLKVKRMNWCQFVHPSLRHDNKSNHSSTKPIKFSQKKRQLGKYFYWHRTRRCVAQFECFLIWKYSPRITNVNKTLPSSLFKQLKRVPMSSSAYRSRSYCHMLKKPWGFLEEFRVNSRWSQKAMG